MLKRVYEEGLRLEESRFSMEEERRRELKEKYMITENLNHKLVNSFEVELLPNGSIYSKKEMILNGKKYGAGFYSHEDDITKMMRLINKTLNDEIENASGGDSYE